MNRLSKGGILKVGMRLRVPKDDGLAKDPNDKNAGASVAAAAGGSSSETVVDDKHVVRAGENLTTIAKKYGVSIDALRKANKLGNRSTLRVGLRLTIPSDVPDKDAHQPGYDGGARRPASTSTKVVQKTLPAKQAKKGSAKSSRKIASKAARSKVHVVRRGENLSWIAAKYNVSLDTLKRKNQMKSGSKVIVGAKLLIPSAEAAD